METPTTEVHERVEALRFHREGRALLVEEWHPRIAMTLELLRAADGRVMVVDRDLVTFIVGNGQATYRIVHWRLAVVIAELEAGWLSHAEVAVGAD